MSPFIIWSFLKSPLGRTAIFAVAVVAAVAWISYSVYTAGQRDAIGNVKRQDEKAVSNADEARRNVDDCYAGGGMWDRYTGKCRERRM